MVAKIGRKFIQGAKEELQKDPPVIFNTENVSDLLQTAILFGIVAMTGFALLKGNKKPVTVIVNNYVNGVLQ